MDTLLFAAFKYLRNLFAALLGVVDEGKRRKEAERRWEEFQRDNPRQDKEEWIYKDD